MKIDIPQSFKAENRLSGSLSLIFVTVAPGKQWVVELKKRMFLVMESPTMAVVGGNSGRGRGGERRCSVGTVCGVCGEVTTSAVAGGSHDPSRHGRPPERLALRAASFTILRLEEEVADLNGGPETDPTTPRAAGSESVEGQTGGEWTVCSRGNSSTGNSSTLKMLYLFSSWSSQGGACIGLDLARFFPCTVDHGSWLGVELLVLNLGFGLKVKVAKVALLLAHLGLAPSSSHGSSAGGCGAAAEEAGLDVAVAAGSSARS
ncbi:uncharacterized protein LOC126409004 [Epinephelus moara]|uniref:uncharacterized protein LOC126402106 n=1 Tax=Epinephelus moara TaxID=300413 RepID=UPI00214E8E5B|nr:uncharacterized protein LOC126402106 [Epinephelus moara]XP_049930821.1 uncharacterized protein LOC126409004 [Epinephelus moara]